MYQSANYTNQVQGVTSKMPGCLSPGYEWHDSSSAQGIVWILAPKLINQKPGPLEIIKFCARIFHAWIAWIKYLVRQIYTKMALQQEPTKFKSIHCLAALLMTNTFKWEVAKSHFFCSCHPGVCDRRPQCVRDQGKLGPGQVRNSQLCGRLCYRWKLVRQHGQSIFLTAKSGYTFCTLIGFSTLAQTPPQAKRKFDFKDIV